MFAILLSCAKVKFYYVYLKKNYVNHSLLFLTFTLINDKTFVFRFNPEACDFILIQEFVFRTAFHIYLIMNDILCFYRYSTITIFLLAIFFSFILIF